MKKYKKLTWPLSGGDLVKYLGEFDLHIKEISIKKIYMEEQKHLIEGEHYEKKETQTEVSGKSREYRKYNENAVDVITQVKTMVDYLDLTHADVKPFGTDGHRLLDHLGSQSRPLFAAVYEKLTAIRDLNPDTWFEHIDWMDLYRFCRTFDELDPIIEAVIRDFDIEEIEEKLKEELYEDIVAEFEDDNGIDLFDEETASESLQQAFSEYLQSRIAEEIDDKSHEMIHARINSSINELQAAHQLPFIKFYATRIKELYEDKRGQDKVTRKADDALGMLDFFDLSLLSILFLNEWDYLNLLICLGDVEAFADLKVEGFKAIYCDYVNDNYDKIRACSKHLRSNYKDQISFATQLQQSPQDVNKIKDIASHVYKLPLPV